MALLIMPDTTEKTIVISPTNRMVTYQQLVGGFFEVIPIFHPKYVYMIVDEEGKLKNKRRNRSATLAASGAIPKGCYIVGNAVLIEAHELE